MSLAIVVIRALGADKFNVDYRRKTDLPRVEARIMAERMQDEFDECAEPLRAYIFRDGVPIEAAYCRREARE